MADKTKWVENLSQLNKTEQLKLKKDGLDILGEIYHYAELGYDAISADDLERLKWAGLYEQRPKNGRFMLRVKVPSGILNSKQAKKLAIIGRDYGRNTIDITTRQAVQFHWLKIEDIPDIFKHLEDIGLSSIEACGDCPRNITGNPLAGVDPYELLDTSELVKQVQDYFFMNKDFSNLPRKFKISLSANIYNTGHAEINDLAFTPALKTINGQKIKGFHVWVGGGLSSVPILAQSLDMFVTPEEVLKVTKGIAVLFRDYGYRIKRGHSRLKFLVDQWGVEKFQEKLTEIIGEIPSSGKNLLVGWNAGYFTGIHRQKQSGFYYAGLSIPGGRMTASELDKLADLADLYGKGTLRTCNSQNIIITDIAREKVADFLKAKVLKRITPFPKKFAGHAVCCTGNEFCSKAVVKTRPWMKAITNYLDTQLELDVPIRLHMSGCPNSCGQTQIADIGLQGTIMKTSQGVQEAFEIYLGGSLGPNANLGKKLKGRVLGRFTPYIISQLVNLYLKLRLEKEAFSECIQREGLEPFQKRYDELKGLSENKVLNDRQAKIKNIV